MTLRKALLSFLLAVICAGLIFAQRPVRFTRISAAPTPQGIKITTFPASIPLIVKSLEIQTVSPLRLEIALPVAEEAVTVYQADIVHVALEEEEDLEIEPEEEAGAPRIVMPVRAGSTRLIVVDCGSKAHSGHAECKGAGGTGGHGHSPGHDYPHAHAHNYCDEDDHADEPICRKDD